MANKKSPLKPKIADNPSFRGFLNIQLNDEDKRIIKANEFSDSDFVSFMDKKIDEGYKFTFSYDGYNHCYQVIGTTSVKESPDYGILLSGRGSTLAKSLKQWLYIVDRLIDGQSWSELLLRKESQEIDD